MDDKDLAFGLRLTLLEVSFGISDTPTLMFLDLTADETEYSGDVMDPVSNNSGISG